MHLSRVVHHYAAPRLTYSTAIIMRAGAPPQPATSPCAVGGDAPPWPPLRLGPARCCDDGRQWEFVTPSRVACA